MTKTKKNDKILCAFGMCYNLKFSDTEPFCDSHREHPEKVLDEEQPDPVNKPPHYTWGKVETIDITEQFNFNCGNVIKYVMRHEHKGKPAEDLKKARYYLTREIDRLEK
jgi:hypothetical protein